jgi:hypothetical protein
MVTKLTTYFSNKYIYISYIWIRMILGVNRDYVLKQQKPVGLCISEVGYGLNA